MRRTALARPLRPPRPPLPVVTLKGDTLPAPTLGWNARDPLALMKRGDAVTLDNWFPTATACELRGGFETYATGMGGTVETLAEWAQGTSRKLVAGANSKLWDASAAGAASDITGGTAPQSNRWQTLMMGGYLHLFDGATVPQRYNGTGTAADAGWSGSGLTPANLIAPTLFKNRIYVAEKNSLAYWYGGVDAVTGTLTKVDLSTIFQRGGELSGIFGWARGAAETSTEVLCFMSSMGEVLVYSGDYPSGAWGLVARMNGPAPVGRRFHQRIGADVALITINGITTIQKLAAGDIADPEIYLSDKISSIFGPIARSYKDNFGWQILLYPQGTQLVTNIPISPALSVQQYVQNTQTGAWCRFLGQNAACWALFNDDLYFGGAGGKVFLADTGADDDGAAIVSDMLFAYDYFKARAQKKRFLNARPLITSNRTVTFDAAVQVDFQNVPKGDLVTQTVTGTPWGSPWGSAWSSQGTTYQEAIGISGVGYAGALRLRASTIGVTARLNAVAMTFEQGSWL